MNLPHIYITGYIYYVTIVTQNRLPIFTRPSFIIPLYDSLNFYRYQHQFYLLGYVIMPDHLHLIIWPQTEKGLSDSMRDFKKFTAIRLIRQANVERCEEWITTFATAGQETKRSQNKVWQDDYWDKGIYSEKFLREKLNYVHRNPCRAGLVESPGDYPYSSFRNYVHNDSSLIDVDKHWLP